MSTTSEISASRRGSGRWTARGTFPFQRSTNEGGTKELREVWPHFQVLSNELSTPRNLVCPETKTAPAKSWWELRDLNITYFVGLTSEATLPQSLLSGDAGFLISGKPPETNLVFLTTNVDISFPQSVHRSIGQIATGDGSVGRLSAKRLKEQLRESGLATNIILLPR